MLIIFVSVFLSAWFALEAGVLGFCLWINHASKRNQDKIRFVAYMEKQFRLAMRDSHVIFRKQMSGFRDNMLIPELKKYGLAIKYDTIPPWDHHCWHVQIIWADNPIYDPQYIRQGGRVEFMTFEGGSCLASLEEAHAPHQKITQHVVLLDEYVRNWIMDARTWHNLSRDHKLYVAKDWANSTYKEMKILADKKRKEEWADMPRMFKTSEGQSVDWWMICCTCGGGIVEYPSRRTREDLNKNEGRLDCSFCHAWYSPLRFSQDIEHFQQWAKKEFKN